MNVQQESNLREIHFSQINGQNKQIVKQIEEYGLYDFWSDYKHYLGLTYNDLGSCYAYYSDAVVIYHRITHR